MQGINSVLGYPLGWIMWLCYQVTHNYVLSLVFFTIIIRLAMLPFAIKQQKHAIQQAMLNPKIEAIRKKYPNNPQKANEEIQKVYTDAGVSISSGCLPLLIQFPVLFGLIDVVYRPIYHILRLPSDVINKAVDVATQVLGTAGNTYSKEITVFSGLAQNPQPFIDAIGADAVQKIQSLDMHFWGMNLYSVPSIKEFGLLWIIPLLAGITAALLSWYSAKTAPTAAAGGAAMSKSMLLVSPIMSIYISFVVPAGVGIYWTIANIIQFIQSIVIHKRYNPKDIAEKIKQAEEEEKERERLERIEARKKKAEGEGSDIPDEKILSEKELNAKKLAEARKRMAEKYGDEYVE